RTLSILPATAVLLTGHCQCCLPLESCLEDTVNTACHCNPAYRTLSILPVTAILLTVHCQYYLSLQSC
ncbi:hypothetical protein NDU88_007754, partial [Pleurodeles waltl]